MPPKKIQMTKPEPQYVPEPEYDTSDVETEEDDGAEEQPAPATGSGSISVQDVAPKKRKPRGPNKAKVQVASFTSNNTLNFGELKKLVVDYTTRLLGKDAADNMEFQVDTGSGWRRADDKTEIRFVTKDR